VDKPTKLEKTRMAQSIVSCFPVLKCDGNAGHVSYARVCFILLTVAQEMNSCHIIVITSELMFQMLV